MKTLSSSGGARTVNMPQAILRPAPARKLSASAPWLLLLFFGIVLFPLYNQFGAGTYSLDQEALSGIVQQTQAGDPVNQAAITTLGLIGAVLLIQYRDRIRLQPLMAPILFASLAWSAATVMWSVDPPLTSKRLVSLVLVILFSAGLAVRVKGLAISIFLAVFPIVTLIAGIAFEVFRGNFQPRAEGYRFCGTAPHPNVEGSILSVGVILLAWLAFQARGKQRIAFALGMLFVAGFLLLTQSRTSLFAVIVALGFSAVLNFVRYQRRRVPILIASSCLLFSVGTLLNMTISVDSAKSPFASAIHRSDDEEGPTSLSGRVDLWKGLWPYVIQRPLRGYGYAGFWTAKHIDAVSAQQEWVIQQGHSGYMDEVLSLGIPGAALYILLLLYCICRAVKLFNRWGGSYGAWAAFLVFIAVHNINESINVFSSFTNLSFYVIALNLAIIRPTLWNETRHQVPFQRRRKPAAQMGTSSVVPI